MRFLILPLLMACRTPAAVPNAGDASSQVPTAVDDATDEDTDYPEPPELVPVRADVCEARSDDPCFRQVTLYVPFYPWWRRSTGELPPPYSEAERLADQAQGAQHLFARGQLYVSFPVHVDVDVSIDPNVLPAWDDAYMPCVYAPRCTPFGDGSEVHPDYPAPDAP